MTTLNSRPADARIADLYSAHHRQVVAYVARRTRPPGDAAAADEVAGEVFALAWQRLAEDPDRAIELPWLLNAAGKVLSQQVRTDTRRSAREWAVGTDRSGPPSTSEDPALAWERNATVYDALDLLSPPDRELLLLRAWDELSFEQIAQLLGISTGAARVRWLRVRRRFAQALDATRKGPQ